MNKNKKGFTLAEVLVCVTIIGVVMALSVNSIRIVKSSYTALTYFTFKNLQDMVGTIYSGKMVYTEAAKEMDADGNVKKVTIWQDGKNKGQVDSIVVKKNEDGSDAVGYEKITDHKGNRVPTAVAACRRNDNNMIENVLKNDHEYNREDYELCNTSGIGCVIPKCSNRSTSSPVDTPVFCSALSAVANVNGTPKCAYDKLFETGFLDGEPYISNLEPDNPNFVTSNGQRYYISKWDKDSRVSSIYGYRLVAVDLNGKSRPNKFANTGGPLPDIVLFLVLDNGEVFPLGHAADNLQRDGRKVTYINAKVKGYYFNTSKMVGSGSEQTEVPIAVSERANAPAECKVIKKIKDSSGNVIKEIPYCNFSVVPVETTKTGASEKYFMTYREAYCLSHDASTSEIVAYRNYCNNSISKSPYCPPSIYSKDDNGKYTKGKAFDKCLIETVRPAFRYNLK